MKKTITEIETIIEERIAELEEEYELDIYDRNDIREEEYKNLCPQIHKAVGRRCTGQTDPSFHKRPDFSQELKTLGLIVLER